jgi:hypothetical protein
MPGSSLTSTARQAEIFAFCLSRSLSPRLWDGFKAVACVEVFDIPAFCARVSAGLPAGARVGGRPGRERIGRRVEYYRPADPVGTRWALPDQIACSKLDGYAWQDEFRLVFSLTDALAFQNVSMALTARNAEPARTTEQGEPLDVAVGSLKDICRIHIARPSGIGCSLQDKNPIERNRVMVRHPREPHHATGASDREPMLTHLHRRVHTDE